MVNEGSMTIKLSISEVSKILFSLKYIIANKTQKQNESREWATSYGELTSEIEEMLKRYEKESSLHKAKES
tara:strand:- start:186 stop:398 length:213 start_codon:yes stop_codon:yes gene_type:complete